MTDTERRLPGWLFPAGVGVLVVGLVAIALLRGPMQLDPDSPEGTVQEYLLAINEGRWDDALEVLHHAWRGTCTAAHIQASAPAAFSAELRAGDESRDVPLGPTPDHPPGLPDRSDFENTARVEVTIRHGGGLGSGWDEYVNFELAEENDRWWIFGEPWPYFSWNCF